jgi:hypothetical protein
MVPARRFELRTLGLKARPRTPQDASSRLPLYSVLRITPPRGTPWHLGLAIQIGPYRQRCQRTNWTRLSITRQVASAVRMADATVTRPTAITSASGSRSHGCPARNAAATLATSLGSGRLRFSASRLINAPTASAWLYKTGTTLRLDCAVTPVAATREISHLACRPRNLKARAGFARTTLNPLPQRCSRAW